ncbi:MAG: hypothetical protein ACJ74Q_09960 [Pyrinomonadaceae bacterium]
MTILLLAPAVARAQWSTPDASGNVSSTNMGNVGVGTTTALTSKLDVNGTAAVSGDLKVATGRLKFTFSGPEGYVQGATERLSFWTADRGSFTGICPNISLARAASIESIARTARTRSESASSRRP